MIRENDREIKPFCVVFPQSRYEPTIRWGTSPEEVLEKEKAAMLAGEYPLEEVGKTYERVIYTADDEAKELARGEFVCGDRADITKFIYIDNSKDPGNYSRKEVILFIRLANRCPDFARKVVEENKLPTKVMFGISELGEHCMPDSYRMNETSLGVELVPSTSPYQGGSAPLGISVFGSCDCCGEDL